MALNTPFVDGKLKGMSGGSSTGSMKKGGKKAPAKSTPKMKGKY